MVEEEFDQYAKNPSSVAEDCDDVNKNLFQQIVDNVGMSAMINLYQSVIDMLGTMEGCTIIASENSQNESLNKLRKSYVKLIKDLEELKQLFPDIPNSTIS